MDLKGSDEACDDGRRANLHVFFLLFLTIFIIRMKDDYARLERGEYEVVGESLQVLSIQMML